MPSGIRGDQNHTRKLHKISRKDKKLLTIPTISTRTRERERERAKGRNSEPAVRKAEKQENTRLYMCTAYL